MKLLVYGHRLEVGGTQINAIELAASLRDEHGFDVVFFAQDGPMRSLIAEKRLRYVPAPDARYHPSIGRMRALRAVVHEERPSILHVWDWWQCLDAFYAVYLPERLPMVVTDMMMEHTRILPRYVPTTFGVPALATFASRAGVRRAIPLVPPIDVVANAPDAVDGGGFRERWSIGAEEFLLVTVSRITQCMKEESLIRSIDAVRALGDTLPVRLVIVGDGTARDRVQARAFDVNVALGRDAVILTGAMLDPRTAYAAADVVIGMGGSSLRGMAFGKPTIVVGIGVFSAIFSPETEDLFYANGLYGDAPLHGEEDALVEQIRSLAVDERARRALGAYGRQFVVENYSLQNAASRLAEFCRSAAAQRPSPIQLAADALRTSAIYLRERRFLAQSREQQTVEVGKTNV